MFRLVCVLLILAPITIESARILGVYPMPSRSHQAVFRALTLELAKRGHELVIVTPEPSLPKNRPPDNITEIDASFAYEKIKGIMADTRHLFPRGVVFEAQTNLRPEIYTPIVDLYEDVVESQELKNLVADKSKGFDLIIAEAFLHYHLIFGKIFKAPLILFATSHGVPDSYEAVGAVARHPIFYPSLLRDEFGSDSIFDILEHVKFEYAYYKSREVLENYENELLKKNYGPNAPTVKELKDNVDLMFVNSHPIFCNHRPVPPNTVYVSPLHIQPLKELPQVCTC